MTDDEGVSASAPLALTVNAVQTGWQVPAGPIPTSSAFYALLSGKPAATQEAYRVLYHWLAHYQSSDFDLPKNGISYDAAFLASDENVFRLRSLLSNQGRNIPEPKIIQVASSNFLLNTIDVGGQTKMKITNGGPRSFVEPISAAWHYTWDYPGNPNYHNEALMHRGFVYAIADMINLDAINETTNTSVNRTDYLGGSLIRYAVPYAKGKSLLPPSVQQAYELILIKMFNRLQTWSLNGTFGDMEIQATVGMFYTAQALNNPTYYSQAAARAQFVYEKMISGAGFEKHENGADVVYQGIAQYFMGWLLSASQADPQAAPLYSWLINYMDRSCKYVNYMTLVEPPKAGATIRVTGPSHFNAANGGALRTFIWNNGFKSFLAGAFYSNQCKTFLQNQVGATYHQYPLSNTVAQFRTDLQSFLGTNGFVNNLTAPDCTGNSAWSVKCSNPNVPTTNWGEDHWSTDTSYGYTYSYYKPNFYSGLMTDIAMNAIWNKFPQQQSSTYIEELQDINEPIANKKPWFVIGKSASMHTIWHLGGLAWRNSATNIAGFGGGALSSVSTVGPIIMGSERGNQDQAFSMSDWQSWPTHHLAGQDDMGLPFTNARDRNINRTVTKNGNQSVTAIATGLIGATSTYTNPGGSINGNVNYERQLTFDQQAGITVRSALNSDSTDQVKSLYEIIPVYLYDPALNDCATAPQECTTIEFRVNGAWVAPTTALMASVTDIKLNRYNAPLYIHFSSPRKVKLSPSEITLVREARHHRNLMIELVGNNGALVALPAKAEIQYIINTVSP